MRKKIAILTFQRAINYGATLQMYALQKVIKDKNYHVEILDYYSNFIYKEYEIFNFINLKNMLHKILNSYVIYKKNKKFRNFIINNMEFSKKLLANDLKNIEKDYDIFIVGSDQVWNPEITNNDVNYFLDFLDNNKKKYSYAASFGISKWKDSYTLDIKDLLKSFQKISVREKTAKDMIHSKIKREIFVNIDPVFLLTRDNWMNFVNKSVTKQKEYILVYTVGNPKYIYEYAKNLSKKYNYEILNIRYKISLKNRSLNIGHTLYDIGPDEFVSLIANAKCIVTNSFHAIAFSIIFNKDFYVELPEKLSSRIEDLFISLGIKLDNNRNIKIKEILNIDWNNINYRLDNKRKESLEYIDSIIKK